MMAVKFRVVFTLFVCSIILAFIDILFFGTTRFSKEQENYFSHVNYRFKGQIVGYSHLGGTVYLLELNSDSLIFMTTNLLSSSDFLGVYDKKSNKVYVLVQIPIWKSKRDNDSVRHYGTVRFDSSVRSIFYDFNDTSFSQPLRTFPMYNYRLKPFESQFTIRF